MRLNPRHSLSIARLAPQQVVLHKLISNAASNMRGSTGVLCIICEAEAGTQVLSAACRFLADIHCFTLANVLRHPIIIYGDKMAAMSGLAGIYLPLLWDDPAGVPFILTMASRHRKCSSWNICLRNSDVVIATG